MHAKSLCTKPPPRQLESGAFPPSRHRIRVEYTTSAGSSPQEPASDCHADERKAWDGALCEKKA